MSHFVVAVAAEKHPDTCLEGALQPFHEFECTGTNDQYVQDISIMNETLQRYAEDDSKGGKTFTEWVLEEDPALVIGNDSPDLDGRHKYGYVRVDNNVVVDIIDRTNPNKRWDWWVLGGRWQGLLLLKPGADGITGNRGVLGAHSGTGVDAALKRDIDFDKMRDRAMQHAATVYDQASAIIRGRSWTPWVNVRDNECSIDKARALYNGQQVLKDLRKVREFSFGGLDEFQQERGAYLENAAMNSFCPFAWVVNGEWIERGKMHMFAMVKDEDENWPRRNAEILASVPDDHWISMVDCHI